MPSMKHLRGALLMRSPIEGQGLCFHRAVAFVLDVPTAKLVIGTIRAATDEEKELIGPDASPVPFIHAWCETGHSVIAPTTYERAGNKLIAFERRDYYEKNGVRDTHILTRAWVKRTAKRFGLDRHLLHHHPLPDGVSFAQTILDEGGIPYRVGEEAVLPPEGGA